ncbi:MAG: HAMP domain-containing histidine kinase [Lachnospiraceae bacterium]|nr:HAMP domain-containing histidine kinase [Lachnospiraceae bacterium]MBO7600015.1 HAMP domain-containing histidine kinase [Lachnospiraceae bacterium]
MKLKTKLYITFASIAILPIILFSISFIVVSSIMIKLRQTGGVDNVGNLMPKSIMISGWICFFVILFVIASLLTAWIGKSVFSPINDLGIGLKQIADGNFDYTLDTTSVDGEISDLYKSYEEMRLRLKENADEKIQNEEQNKELITNISHDLKTPITAIKGYVEGIMDGVADSPEKMDKYIKTIYNKANDMDRLINELTIYSKIDTNRIPYTFLRLNVSDYFNDCIEEVGVELESKGIELNYTNFVPADTRIIADPEQLKRVINNIISNSVKYMDKEKEKGIIDIRILDEADAIKVEIEDNGRGIAAKDLPNIFERFYRTDSSRNSSKGGSGIGLSIVKKIVEDHGGYIFATSKEGEGTCMHFILRKYEEANKDE